MPILIPRPFLLYTRCTMMQPGAFAALKPSERVVSMSGTGKLWNALLLEKRRTALAKPWCNAEQLQRRSKLAESFHSPVRKCFGRSSFWSDVNRCKDFSTARVVSKNLGEFVDVPEELVERSIPTVDQARFCEGTEAASLEVASSEVEGNGESSLSADTKTAAATAEMDGNA